MGKMRITERIGGFFRPKISQEVGFFVFGFGDFALGIFFSSFFLEAYTSKVSSQSLARSDAPGFTSFRQCLSVSFSYLS